MKTKLFYTAVLVLALTGLSAQTSGPGKSHNYTYDANGNRIERNMQPVVLKTANPQQITTLPNGLTEEDITEGTTLQLGQELTLKAYPNPTTAQITVSLSQQEESITVTEARLSGANGSVQSTVQNPGVNFKIDLVGLAAGNYMLWLKLSNGKIERVQVLKL